MIKKRNRAMCLLLAVAMLLGLSTNALAVKPAAIVPESALSQTVLTAYEEIKGGMGLPGLNGFDGANALPGDNSPVSVIVLFKNQPAATVKAAAEIEGNTFMPMSTAVNIAEGDHISFRADIAAMFGGKSSFSKTAAAEYEITSEYHNALNGVVITLPANYVEEVSKLDSVYAVYPNAEVRLDKNELASLTPVTHGGNPSGGKGGRDQMNADALHQMGIKGAGVDILIIDSGVDYNHPALSPAFMTQSPSGNSEDLRGGIFYGRNFVDNDYDYVYRDDNDPLEATYEEYLQSDYAWTMDGSEFSTMHGTHVTGTAVARDVLGEGNDNGALGVAPEANVYVYRVFGAYSRALTSFILNAIEYVAIDKPDIVNMSLGAGINNADFLYSLAVNNIMIQHPNIVFVIAAGNYGENGVFSLGSPSTSSTAITVANASAKIVNTEYRVNTFRSTNGNVSQGTGTGRFIRPLFMDMASTLTLQAVEVTNPVSGAILYNNVYVSDYPNLKLHTEGPLKGKYKLAIVLDATITSYGEIGTGTKANFEYTEAKFGENFFEGSIVVVRRGEEFSQTAKLAMERGAGAVLLINHSINNDPSGIETFRGRSEDYLPFFVIEYDDWGSSISTYPAPNGNFAVENGFGFILSASRTTATNPVLDISSSRGPVSITFDIKPDVSSHGTAVTSTVPLYNESYYYNSKGYDSAYGISSGTSMSSPHVAGAAALLRCANADMSAEEIKVRLMNSAKAMNSTSSSIDAKFGVYEQGAGLVDVLAAYNAKASVSVEYDNVSVPTLSETELDYNAISKASRSTGSFSFGRVNVSEDIPVVTKELTAKITNTSDSPVTYKLLTQFNTKGALVIDPMQNSGWDELAKLEFEYEGKKYDQYGALIGGTWQDPTLSITVPAGGTAEFNVTLKVDNQLMLKHGFHSGSLEGYVILADASWNIALTLPFAGYAVLNKEPIEDAFLNRPVISTSETNRQTEFSSNADFFFSLNKQAQLNFAVLNPDLYDRSKVVDGLISYEDLTAVKMLMGSLENSFVMELFNAGGYDITFDVLDGTYYPFAFDSEDPSNNFPIGVYYPDNGQQLPKLEEGLNALLVEVYTFEGDVYYYVFEFYVDNTPPAITLAGGDVNGDYGSIPGVVNDDTVTLAGTVYDNAADIMAEHDMYYGIWEEGDELGNTPDQSFTVLYAEVDGAMYKADVNPQTGAFTVDIPKTALNTNILLHAVDGFSIKSFLDSMGNHATAIALGFEPSRPSCGEAYIMLQSENYGFVGSNLNTMLVAVGQTGSAFTVADEHPQVFAGEAIVVDVLFNGEALLAGDSVASAAVANELFASAAVSGNQVIVAGLREGATALTITTTNGLSRTFELTVKINYSEGVDLSKGVEVYYGAMKHLVNYSFAADSNLALPAASPAGYETEDSPIVWTVMGTETLPNGTEGNLSLLSKYVLDVRKFTENGGAKYYERDETIRHYLNGGYWFVRNWDTNDYTMYETKAEDGFQQYFTETELSAVPPVTNQVYSIINGEAERGVSTISYGDKFFLPWSALTTEGYGMTLKVYYSINWSAGSGLAESNAIISNKTASELTSAPELAATLKNGRTYMPYWTETPTDLSRIQIVTEHGAEWTEFGTSAWLRSGFRPAMTLDIDRVIYAATDASGISRLTLVADEPESIGAFDGSFMPEKYELDEGAIFSVESEVVGSGYDSVAYKILDENRNIVCYEVTYAQDLTDGRLIFNTSNLPAGEYKIIVWPQKSNDLYSNEAGEPAVLYVTVGDAAEVPDAFSVIYSANGGTGSTIITDAGLFHSVLAADTFTAPNGMVFDSWNTSADGRGTAYAPNEEIDLTENLILYAIWAAKQKTLVSIETPEAISGIANGADATAEALGLPAAITIETDDGSVLGSVIWDFDGVDYYPELEEEQSFIVTGAVILPDDVNNPNNVQLTVLIHITVLAKAEGAIEFMGVIQPEAIIGLANGTEKTSEALGLPASVIINTSCGKMAASVEWDVDSADYNPSSLSSQTFTVHGVVTIPEDVVSEETEIEVTINVSVNVAAKALVAITAPDAITGIANGTEKTSEALGLPETVEIETTFGYQYASVTWNVADCAYNPAWKTKQSFTVKGIVSLPSGIANTDGVSLETAVSVTVNAEIVIRHIVTFNANGGKVKPGSMATNKDGRLASLPTPTRSGYSFEGWFTHATGGVLVDASRVFTKDTTIYAQWKYRSPVVPDYDDKADEAIPEVVPAPSTPGESIDSVDTGNNAVATPEDQKPIANEDDTYTLPGGGTVETSGGAQIDVPAGTTIDTDGAIIIPDEKEGEMTLPSGQEISLPGGSVINPDGGVAINGDVQVLLTDSVAVEIPQGSTIDNQGHVTIGDGGATVNAGSIDLHILEGTVIILDASTPLGYTIVFDNPFADVGNEIWFVDHVAFAYSHGLFQGTGNDTFSPNTAMTRGMLVTVLARLDGVDLSEYSVSRFADAGEGMWYTAATEWSAAMGIASGDGTNFMPNQAISREQLAVMIYNYAMALDYELPTDTAQAFADDDSISSWAQEAVSALQAAGIITGRPGNIFDPHGGATRAEVAAMLQRFAELMAS